MNKNDARMIRDSVLEITDNPFVAVRRLAGSAFFRMRAGNYRIIMDLQQKTMIIFIIDADHRKRVYSRI